MKLNEAIRDHQEVRDLLKRYIARETPQTGLGLFNIGRDTSCPLGEWMYRSKTIHSLAELPEFQHLIMVHQNFHGLAYAVLTLALNHKNDEALALLDGAYTVVEAELIGAIQALGATQQD